MLIKIVRIPTGEAPAKIRQDWVGVVMKVDEAETASQPAADAVLRTKGALGGKPNPDNFTAMP